MEPTKDPILNELTENLEPSSVSVSSMPADEKTEHRSDSVAPGEKKTEPDSASVAPGEDETDLDSDFSDGEDDSEDDTEDDTEDDKPAPAPPPKPRAKPKKQISESKPRRSKPESNHATPESRSVVDLFLRR